MAKRETLQIVDKFDSEKIICDYIRETGTDESFFINSVGEVVRRFALWKEVLPRVTPYFAIKSNYHPTIVGTLAAMGELSLSYLLVGPTATK